MNVASLLLGLLVASAPAASWGPKSYGVLLLCGSVDKGVSALTKDFKDKFPVEVVFGLGDFKEIQKGLDRLAAKRVKKIVVVPLVLTTESAAMEQTKYVLGLRQDPDPEFFKNAGAGYTNVKRAQTKLEITLTSALDDHAVVGQILALRAAKLSERAEKEKIVLIGRGAASDSENDIALRHLRSLAAKVKQAGSFSEAEAFSLREDAERDKRDKAHKEVRTAVAAMSRKGRVIVIPHLLSTDGTERAIRKVLDGTFYSFDGKGLLPDPMLGKWVEDKAAEAAALPDMRRFKDTGRPLPPPDRKKLLQLDSGRGGASPQFKKPGDRK